MKPGSLLEYAERLVGFEDNEENYRAVASRAYYAAFHAVLNHQADSGEFTRSKSGEDHRALIDHLKRSNNPLMRTLGIRHLPRIRALRNRADYELPAPFSREHANETLEDATEVLQAVAAL